MQHAHDARSLRIADHHQMHMTVAIGGGIVDIVWAGDAVRDARDRLGRRPAQAIGGLSVQNAVGPELAINEQDGSAPIHAADWLLWSRRDVALRNCWRRISKVVARPRCSAID